MNSQGRRIPVNDPRKPLFPDSVRAEVPPGYNVLIARRARKTPGHAEADPADTAGQPVMPGSHGVAAPTPVRAGQVSPNRAFAPGDAPHRQPL